MRDNIQAGLFIDEVIPGPSVESLSDFWKESLYNLD